MRVYRRYRCEHGHEWTVTTKQDIPEGTPQTYCPEGHKAITCNEELPADEVQVLLRPAARIVDPVIGKLWLTGRYYLVLLDRADQELCVSREHYTWDELIRLASQFRGKSETVAMDWWNRRAR
jgi:hypothetical protein